MRVIILTTRLNSVWLSMQEIIPGIEDLWKKYAEARRIEIDTINCDEALDLPTNMKKLLEAKLIVVTAFNLKIVQAVRLIRLQLGIDAPIAFYLHNQATIACWPLKKWKLIDCLNSRDTFISTCSRDKETFKALFENGKCLLTPFSYQELATPAQALDYHFSKVERNFVYVGRISDQKNLHSLMTAFSFLKSQDSLHLFGGEDSLGSPNMEMPSSKTLMNLKELAKTLQISSRVFFHGHQPRETLYHYLKSTPHIFVSASLHSDENFGMAAFRSLCLGANAVLSDWGGHSDFSKYFPDQVKYARVVESQRGPFLNPFELAKWMEATKVPLPTTREIPTHYQERSLFRCLDTLMEQSAEGKTTLAPTALSLAVWRQQDKIAGPSQCRAFTGYEDPLAHEFFRLYGAQKPSNGPVVNYLVPWVKKQGANYLIQDPHRGEISVQSERELANLGYLF